VLSGYAGKKVELSTVLPQGLATLPLRSQCVDPVKEVILRYIFVLFVLQPIVVYVNLNLSLKISLNLKIFLCPKIFFTVGSLSACSTLHLSAVVQTCLISYS